jgi:serine/threonine-protein kinase
MSLSPGARLGAYEIVGALGAGGMGEVYRARDTKLGREVAIKILPPSFVQDPERVARFQREAQLLAALNHPHIAAIHGLEDHAGTPLLVLELVEGQTLADRLADAGRVLSDPPSGAGSNRLRQGFGGPPKRDEGLHSAKPEGPGLHISEALTIARQIADALEAAHDKGIIHRDLKPANIAFTADGQVKVLDFGLAKALDAGGAHTGRDALSHSPTLTAAATQAGVILGTAAYMAPEQAKGRAADKRSDVWAFGCVLYEMLAGKRAFGGEDLTDTIAAVVRGEPDWNALPADLSHQIRLLLTRCLEKDRRARVADISVAKFLMTETIAAPMPAASASAAQPRAGVSRRGVTAAIGLAFLLGIALAAASAWVLLRLTLAPSPRAVRFTITPPASQPMALSLTERDVAIAPDGSHIVYRSGTASDSQLVVRALDRLDSLALQGTAGARTPFVSHNSRWIGFFAPDGLKKVSTTGGPAITLCTYTGPARGASWGPDDVIVFATGDLATGLMSVPAGGGEPTVLTRPDVGQGEQDHVFPSVLPGGEAVLFTTTFLGQPGNTQIAVFDQRTRQTRTLIRGGGQAQYVESGHLVYAVDGTLRAVRFDPERLEVLGDPVPVADDVMTLPTGAANFDVSRDGSLLLVSGTIGDLGVTPRSLVWVNRQGHEEPIDAPQRTYAVARLSPDGTEAALDIRDRLSDIWIWNFARRTLTPLTVDPSQDMSPVWTHDGKRLILTSVRSGNPNLYWQAADGTGTVERLTSTSDTQFPTAISRDGRLVLLNEISLSSLDVLALTLGGGGQAAAPLVRTAAQEANAELSPDGRWVAYQSNESGRFEIYVRPFPNVDEGRWPVSPSGGTRPAWAPNGRELFYLDATGLLAAVPVQATAATFTAGTATTVLTKPYYAGYTTRGYDLRGYDIAPDGRRFLMIKEEAASTATGGASQPSMTVVLNWIGELKEKVK